MEKKDTIIRIALIGPESTGKSTLAKQLAEHYQTLWIEEYAREYLPKLSEHYTINDILAIAQEQLRRENAALPDAHKFLFADTELILAKVWSEDLYNDCPAWISDNILPYKYDLYLLTYPDLDWKEDPLRENPHRRKFLYDWYEKELKLIDATYAVIKGHGDARLINSIRAIENFLQH
ncbi:MAG: AAA family ATPase [Bacteroidia bacterium]